MGTHDIIKTVKERTLTTTTNTKKEGNHYGKEIKQLQKDSTIFTEDL